MAGQFEHLHRPMTHEEKWGKSKEKKESLAKKFSFHDLHSNSHRPAEYSEVRSSLKKSYSKKSSGKVREMAQNLKPRTSEAIPAKGGYYSREK